MLLRSLISKADGKDYHAYADFRLLFSKPWHILVNTHKKNIGKTYIAMQKSIMQRFKNKHVKKNHKQTKKA